jgi:hypothetical protein
MPAARSFCRAGSVPNGVSRRMLHPVRELVARIDCRVPALRERNTRCLHQPCQSNVEPMACSAPSSNKLWLGSWAATQDSRVTRTPSRTGAAEGANTQDDRGSPSSSGIAARTYRPHRSGHVATLVGALHTRRSITRLRPTCDRNRTALLAVLGNRVAEPVFGSLRCAIE